VLSGTAKYSTGFTPTASPLSVSTANQTLLACYSNRFIDANTATTAKTITVTGTPTVQAVQPFSPAAPYTAATYGGSGYFSNAPGNNLLVPASASNAIGTGQFTVEAWVYLGSKTNVTGNTDHSVISQGNNATNQMWALILLSNGTGLTWGLTGSTAAVTTTIPLNSWVHVAVSRDASNSEKIFVNGVLVNTRTNTTNYNSVSSYQIQIGSQYDTNYPGVYSTNSYSNTLLGYISNLRLVIGTAVYTGAFTPPTLGPITTAGLSSSSSYINITNVNTNFGASNTSLLLNFTNAAIYDAAVQNNVTTVGDAQASTTQYKWSPTSVRFDGTGDTLSLIPSTAFGLGTGDWTIEFWLYFTVLPGVNTTLVSLLTSGSSTAPHIYYATGSGLRYYTLSADRITGGALNVSTWYYIAITKASGNTKMYINGVQTGSTYTDANNYGTSNPFAVADYAYPLNNGSALNGYIQDVRITKGYARTITTPALAFQTR
jgi:hypothetical protein